MNQKVFNQQTVRRMNGFTLVEILVSVFVLSVGMLGMSKMQIVSLRMNQHAYQRSMATQLSYDMANRMRANLTAVAAGDYESQSPAENTTCLSASGCSSTEMAAHDKYEWLSESSPNSVSQILPEASATICLDSTPEDGEPTSTSTMGCDGAGNLYAIKIWWTNDAGDDTYRFVTSVQL